MNIFETQLLYLQDEASDLEKRQENLNKDIEVILSGRGLKERQEKIQKDAEAFNVKLQGFLSEHGVSKFSIPGLLMHGIKKSRESVIEVVR